jgi:hypothetical protein
LWQDCDRIVSDHNHYQSSAQKPRPLEIAQKTSQEFHNKNSYNCPTSRG